MVLAGENVTFYEKKPNCKRITTTFEDEPDAEGFTIPANFPSVELWEADNYTLSGEDKGSVCFFFFLMID